MAFSKNDPVAEAIQGLCLFWNNLISRMMSVTTSQINQLHHSTEYERWSLRALADLSGDVNLEILTVGKLEGQSPGRKITLSGNRHAYVSASVGIGAAATDEAIQNMSPLIFVSSYKTLDLFIEWILEINGESTTGGRWTFSEKIDRINELISQGMSTVPYGIDSDFRVIECIADIYSELVDYRHSVVHNSKFQVNNSTLLIEDDSGNTYSIDEKELFSLAGAIIVTIDSIIQDAYDYVSERQIKSLLDNLAFIHSQPQFGLTDYDSEKIECPMEPLQINPYRWEPQLDLLRDLAPVKKNSPNFWLHAVGLHNNNVISEWLIPGDAVEDLLDSGLILPKPQFSEYQL